MGDDLSQIETYKHEQDKISTKGINLPDWWEGHGRMSIRNRDDFGDREREFALSLLSRLSEKYPDTDSERLAEKAVEMTNEKLN